MNNKNADYWRLKYLYLAAYSFLRQIVDETVIAGTNVHTIEKWLRRITKINKEIDKYNKTYKRKIRRSHITLIPRS